MKKGKINLKSIKVNSFVTDLGENTIKTVKGGGSESQVTENNVNCFSDNDSVICPHTALFGCSDLVSC